MNKIIFKNAFSEVAFDLTCHLQLNIGEDKFVLPLSVEIIVKVWANVSENIVSRTGSLNRNDMLPLRLYPY